MRSVHNFFFFICFVIPACSHKYSSRDVKSAVIEKTDSVKKKKILSFAEDVRLQEAKLSDIPMLFNAVPLPDYYNDLDGNIMLGYQSNSSREYVIDFYDKEMERLGWHKIAFFHGHESLFYFEKPKRLCIISIRSSNQMFHHAINTIVIFISNTDSAC